MNSYGAPCKRLVFELRLLGAFAGRGQSCVAETDSKVTIAPLPSNPRKAELAYRPLPAEMCLEHVFSVREYRHIGPGQTFSYGRKIYSFQYHISPENINTMTMDNELLLLVILSSVAQQEVENISSNVKKGLKMKMKRGELVGF